MVIYDSASALQWLVAHHSRLERSLAFNACASMFLYSSHIAPEIRTYFIVICPLSEMTSNE